MAKQNLQSIELKVLVEELSYLKGGYFEKFYKTTKGYVLAISKQGKKLIEILPGIAFYSIPELVEETLQNSFVQKVRKELEHLKLEDFYVYKSERIVIFDFGKRKLVFEFFKPGIVCLVDNDWKIIASNIYKDFGWRSIKIGETYKFRDSLDPFNWEDFRKIKESNRKDLIRALAMDLGLGRVYANELLLRTGIENKKPSEVSEEELKKLYETLLEIYSNRKPQIVGDFEDVIPFELLYYSEKEKKYFDSYNEAVKFYYENVEIESEEDRAIKRKLESIEKTIRELEERISEYQQKGDLIMANLAFLEELREKILEAASQYGWEKTKEFLKKKGIEVNEKEGYFVIDL